MNRQKLLSLMMANEWVISVYEHVGYERLVFSNGIENDFRQSIGRLFNDLSASDCFGKSVSIASVVMTMPRFKLSGAFSVGAGDYNPDNLALLEMCRDWFCAHPNNLPLPFLSFDAGTDISAIERLIKRGVLSSYGH